MLWIKRIAAKCSNSTLKISSLAEPCLEAWITLVLSAVSSADRSEIVRELGLENRGARS